MTDVRNTDQTAPHDVCAVLLLLTQASCGRKPKTGAPLTADLENNTFRFDSQEFLQIRNSCLFIFVLTNSLNYDILYIVKMPKGGSI